jgi:hypothetical protein
LVGHRLDDGKKARLDDVLQDVEFFSACTSDGKPLHRSFSIPWKTWRLSSPIHPIRGQGVLVSRHYQYVGDFVVISVLVHGVGPGSVGL